MAATDRVSDALIDRTASQSAAGRLIVETIPNGVANQNVNIQAIAGNATQTETDADGRPTGANGWFPVYARLEAFNRPGAVWDRLTAAITNINNTATGIINTIIGGARTRGGTYSTVEMAVNLTDTYDGEGAISVASVLNVEGGTTAQRAKAATATRLATNTTLGAQVVEPSGQKSTSHTPAAGTQASASLAAGAAGVRHVCKSITIMMSATTALAAITTVTVNLRDGASGAGTILKSWQWTLPAATLSPQTIVLSGLQIFGSAATAMTLEFSAAVGNLMEGVSMETVDASG